MVNLQVINPFYHFQLFFFNDLLFLNDKKKCIKRWIYIKKKNNNILYYYQKLMYLFVYIVNIAEYITSNNCVVIIFAYTYIKSSF